MIKLTSLANEAIFRKSEDITHVMDVPMFSVFVSETDVPLPIVKSYYAPKIKKECERARSEIHQIGFPSMHANIVIKDLSNVHNPNTGETGVAGQAHHYKKYMDIDAKHFYAETIVHEWAHLWMMNNSKDFKKAIEIFYHKLKQDMGYKMDAEQDVDRKISSKEESDILDVWGDGINKMFKYLSMGRESGLLTISGKKMKPDFFPMLPHLVTFNARLIRPFTVSNLQGRDKSLQANDDVYVTKGNNGWLVGVNEGNTRYEAVMNFEDLSKYVASNQSGDLLKDIQIAVQKEVVRNHKYSNRRALVEKIDEEIKRGLTRLFEDVAKKFKSIVTTEEIETVASWSKYVTPIYIKILRNQTLLTTYKAQPNKVYETLWVSNPNKPEDLSFVKFFSKILNKNKIYQLKKDFGTRDSFVGKEYEQHREIMQKLSQWAYSYGMSNKDELWATAIDSFFKLPLNYRKTIVKIMLYL